MIIRIIYKITFDDGGTVVDTRITNYSKEWSSEKGLENYKDRLKLEYPSAEIIDILDIESFPTIDSTIKLI